MYTYIMNETNGNYVIERDGGEKEEFKSDLSQKRLNDEDWVDMSDEDVVFFNENYKSCFLSEKEIETLKTMYKIK